MTLTLKNISKSFGSVQVLHDISTQFQPGTVTALVGDNGAGKTTLLKILAGIHRPDSGSVTLEGANTTASTPEAHRAAGIEMVFQDLALCRQQDVVDNLFLGREQTSRFGFLRRRIMTTQAQDELRRLGITLPHMQTPVGLLSGGQQQAIAIARAAMFGPKVLLLDEPTAALAAREVEQVIGLIKHQRAQGRIVVLVSHRLNDVFAVADRLIVLKHGAIHSDMAAAETSLTKTVEQIVA